eukprot:SAG11_NODE_5432_length_1562_cov_3.303486_2_plen_95_part_01
MAAVHAGGQKHHDVWSTDRGKGTGSEQVSTAGSSCEPKEKEASTHPGDSRVNDDFLPIFGFISFLECGHFHSTSGIAASCGAVSPFPLLAPAPDN